MNNPVAWIVSWLAQKGLEGLLSGTSLVLRALVLHPLAFSRAAETVVIWSRDLAAATVSGMLVLGGLTVAADLVGLAASGLTRRTWSGLVIRAAVAVAGLFVLVPAVTTLLTLNNAVVAHIMTASMAPLPVRWGTDLLSLSPLLLLAVMALLTIVLIGLGVVYVTRAIQILWLTALMPWFLLAWLVTGNGEGLMRPCRELLVLIFQQALQALAWWIATRLVWTAASVDGLFLAVGSLWFLWRVPDEARRLMGLAAGGGGRRPW